MSDTFKRLLKPFSKDKTSLPPQTSAGINTTRQAPSSSARLNRTTTSTAEDPVGIENQERHETTIMDNKSQGTQQVERKSEINIAKPRPSLVENFIGRRDILDAMRRTHIDDRSSQAQSPSITVLYGLGGSGKTQTALKFALEMEREYSDLKIFFINSSSEKMLKADLEALIRSGKDKDASGCYKDALEWLATKFKNWLLVFDNVDDPSIGLLQYIPRCTHGNVIITTRNANNKTLAPHSSHQLEGLSTDEAIELILSSSASENTKGNRAIATNIVLALGNLPLALAQAAGYILVHKCLGTYLEEFNDSEGKLLSSLPCELPAGYPSSVATTIQMTLDRLPQRSQDLMRLLAHLDFTSISHEIIARSANRRFRQVIWTNQSELEPQTLQHATALDAIFSPNGDWVEAEFNDIIIQCLQCSLLRLTKQGTSKFYSMHILVQSYLQATTNSIQNCRLEHLVVRLLGSSVTLDNQYKYLAFSRMLAPHLRVIEPDDVVEAGDCIGFAETFYDAGSPKLAAAYGERGVDMWKTSLGERSWKTLSGMGNLAIAYWKMGNPQKAVEIEEKVLEIRKELHGVESRETLRTMTNLAASYSDVGRDEEALKLEEEVMEIQKRVLGLKHHSTLLTMSNLASSYNTAGRYQEASELAKEVLEKQKAHLGLENPDTIRTMRNLAVSYGRLKRNNEALELEREALKLQTQIMGVYNPDTLFAIRSHLITLRNLGMTDEMNDLLKVALPAHEKSLGRDHPQTVKLKEKYRKEITAIESQ